MPEMRGTGMTASGSLRAVPALLSLALAAACASAPAGETVSTAATTVAATTETTAPPATAGTLPPNNVLRPGGCLDGISPDLLPVAGSFENMNEADMLVFSEVWSYMFTHCTYDDLAYYSDAPVTEEEYQEGRESMARLCAMNAYTAEGDDLWGEKWAEEMEETMGEEWMEEMEEAREAAREMTNGMLCSSVADVNVEEMWGNG